MQLAKGAGLVVKVAWQDEIMDVFGLKRAAMVQYPQGKVFSFLSEFE
jgi:hypothetical protein